MEKLHTDCKYLISCKKENSIGRAEEVSNTFFIFGCANSATKITENVKSSREDINLNRDLIELVKSFFKYGNTLKNL